MKKHPVVYEINTRIFLGRYHTEDERATLSSVPESYWQSLADKGVNAVWLMGIWKTCPTIVDKCCFEEGLMQQYNHSLKDWQRDDVTGSPYAIDYYEINPEIAELKELRNLKKSLNEMGISLLLDFVPNHFNADTFLLQTHPGIFLKGNDEAFRQDPHTFFQTPYHPGKYFAHGRDPFFPAWTDTIQLDYYNPGTRSFMTEQLLYIGSLCDGVRCDMAMLVLNNIFRNTWGGILNDSENAKPVTEFWKDAIEKVKSEYPDFQFIAETYWDLEWELQQLGFDFTYDKKLYDRMKQSTVKSINLHLGAELEYQNKLVRFIENHDEERAASVFGKEKSLAAAIIMSTIPGMRLFHDGQWQGKKIRLPVQLGREPLEQPNYNYQNHYDKLLTIVNDNIFHEGEWELLETIPSWENNLHFENMLAWQWKKGTENLLVVVNYSSNTSQCRIKLNLEGFDENFLLEDMWDNTKYWRSCEEVQHLGLYIELGPWQAHLLKY